MIILIIYLTGLYIWLLQEVGLIRLPWQSPIIEIPSITPSDICSLCRRIGWGYQPILYGYNKYESAMTPLCGWQWIVDHEHDLDDYNPTVVIKFDGYSSTMQIQDLSIIKGLVKTITKTYKPYKPSRRKYVDLARVPV